MLFLQVLQFLGFVAKPRIPLRCSSIHFDSGLLSRDSLPGLFSPQTSPGTAPGASGAGNGADGRDGRKPLDAPVWVSSLAGSQLHNEYL